jgi:hypothetical protein
VIGSSWCLSSLSSSWSRPIAKQLSSGLKRLRGIDPVSGRIEYVQTGPGGNASATSLPGPVRARTPTTPPGNTPW